MNGKVFMRVEAVCAPIAAALIMQVMSGQGAELAILALWVLAMIALELILKREAPACVYAYVFMLSLMIVPVYLLVLEPSYGGIVADSDSALYDAVALRIAKSVPVAEQLNPISYGYVHDYGDDLGYAIAAPGYFKFLGIVYSLAKIAGVDGAWIAIQFNVVAVCFIAAMIQRAGVGLGATERSAALWAAAFAAHPVTLLSAYNIRKDAVVLLVFVWGAYRFVFSGERPRRWASIGSVILMVPLRPAYAILMAGWGAANVAFARARRRCAVGLAGPTAAVACVLATWLAMQTVGAPLLRLCFGAHVDVGAAQVLKGEAAGLSSKLLSSIPGRIVYAVAFPFPNAKASDWWELYHTLLCIVSIAWTAMALRAVFKCSDDPRLRILGVGWGLALTQALIVVEQAVGDGLIGVLEPRYKLAAIALSLMLAMGGWAVRTSGKAARMRPAEA